MLAKSLMFIISIDSATVQDLIGLAFWKYNEGRKGPIKFVSVVHYIQIVSMLKLSYLVEFNHKIYS